jgi:HPt (histidine-containing phosphotransfer) domain-containing protein
MFFNQRLKKWTELFKNFRLSQSEKGIDFQEWSVISQRLGEPISKEILRIFLLQASTRKLALRELKENNEPIELADLVHNLKSSCLAIGALPAARICTVLEKAVREADTEISAPLNSLIGEIEFCEDQIREVLQVP